MIVTRILNWSNFESITQALQDDGIRFVEVLQGTFDLLIEYFPDIGLEHHRGHESSHVIDKNFEAGISEGVPPSLQQQAAVVNFVKSGQGGGGAGRVETSVRLEEATGDNDEGYAVCVAKRLKIQKFENSIPGTSVNCERLFSLAKHIFDRFKKKHITHAF